MSLVLQSSGGGQITIQEPTTASNFTATLPAATGDVMVSGNMPAFSAYADATTQTLATATYTKILFQTEEFDTNNNFSSSRFTPTVAGYYQVSSQLLFPALAGFTCLVAIYKNGADFKEGTRTAIAATASGGVYVSALVYCNGSTDYIEIYGQQTSGTSQNLIGTNNQFLNYFQAVMVRAE